MDSKCPLVSVVIITYNQRKYLIEMVESVLSQDYRNIEIIISDDCSTDGTIETLMEYKKRYPSSIKVILSDINQGVTKNSNRGISNAKGKYVCMVGGDDIFKPNKISRQVKVMEGDPRVLISAHPYTCIDESGSILKNKVIKIPYILNQRIGVKRLLKSGLGIGAVTIMVRNSDMRRFDESLPIVSDTKWVFDILGSRKGLVYFNENLAYYRWSLNSVSKRLRRKCMLDLRDFFKLIELKNTRYRLTRKEIKLHRDKIYVYGSALNYLRLGNKPRGRKILYLLWKRYPFSYKIIFRYLASYFS